MTATDWERFHEMDILIFPEDSLTQESFEGSLAGMNVQTVVMVHKESKEFIGYYRLAVYGTLGHIARIGVHPAYRRKGSGKILVEKSIYYLKWAGCKKYYLYVLKDNEGAIELYKKSGFKLEANSYQYFVPDDYLVEKPRGHCRHVEWGEIQMIALRFNLNPFQIQQYFTRENQLVFIYELMGQQIGFCRFSPNFPGAMPFILKDPNYLADFVSILHTYITKKDIGNIRITFDGQERLLEKCIKDNLPLNYELLRMSRLADLD